MTFLPCLFADLELEGLYTVIHPMPLIYVLLPQTMSNNNNENFDKKVDDCRRELLECPSWSLDSRCQLLEDLSKALYDRFLRLGGIEYLEESITCCRQRLNLCPIGDPNRTVFLNNFAITVWTRFEQLGGMEDLDEAISCHRQVLALFPHCDPISLNNLANAVSTRFRQLGRMADLEEAITCHRQALTLRPHGHPDRSVSLNNLANAVSTRYEQLGRMDDLEEAITCHRQALALLPHGHPDRSFSLSNFANVVSTRFKQFGRMDDLEEAITCHRQALALRRLHGHPDRSSSLNNLANALFTCFEQLGGMNDLEEAITCYRQALALRPHGHPDRSSSLNNLASAVLIRFNQLGRMYDLKEAITCYRRALALRPHGHPDRSSSLSNLASAVSTRFEQLGRMDDLEEAITCHRQALALLLHGHPNRQSSLYNLAIAVSTRFKQLGRMDDLEEAISCHREALALRPHGHPNRSSSLINLANTVSTRFEQLGGMDDLKEAITCHCQALALLPHGHPDRPSSFSSLANAMFTRFEQLGRMDDLEEAITCHRQALALLLHGHPRRPSSLSNLASVVSFRFEQLGRMDDLEEAITCHRQALALLLDGHPNRPSSLVNLAGAVLTRFKQSWSNNDLLDVVKYLSEAKNILPRGHPHQSKIGSFLASILLIYCDIVSKSNESLYWCMMTKAFELFEHAADHSPAGAKDRFDAAVRWAKNAHHREHPSAVHAYTKSLTLLGRRLILAPTIEAQQNLLANVPKTLALDAASCSINRGEFRSAIELLEQGRAVLWSRLRDYRHPLDKLRTIDKELFDQFETLSGQLERLSMSVESRLSASESSRPSFEAKMQQHRILSEKWDDVVDKIRQIDGFTDFLRAVPFATLQTAAAEGPIIIINISQYRSDAIILRDIGDPVIVSLHESLPTILAELSSQFATACASQSKDSARLILRILRSLWDNIAFPVRTQLVALGVPDKSRIWWCPTSVLCGLPLHAAGKYSPKIPKPNSIPDCYISSYTPSLSALIKARSGLVPRTTNPHLLVIAQPDETLPMVNEESGHIQRLLNNADILEGRDASHDTVLSGLRTHSWVHFACHGHLSDQPFHSSFQLHDNSRLELVKLIPAQCPDAELAFLSACHSAAGDVVGTPDEVVHLAAALQFCGFRSVVGTLWAMEDVDGCDATKNFYQYMFRIPGAVPNFRDSAEALHLATRAMRKRGLGLDRWAKFVHVGA